MDEEQLKQLCEAVIDSMFNTAPTDERRERARAYMQELLANKELNWDAPGMEASREFFQNQLNKMDIEELPMLQSLIIQKHVIPNNKLANMMTRDVVEDGPFELTNVAGRGKGAAKVRCIVTYEGDNVEILGKHPFTEYDRQVFNAVCSLFIYGHKSHLISPAMVYRAMTHDECSMSPSPQQIAAVTKSLDKMRFMRVVINWREEAEKRKLQLTPEYKINGGQYDDYLLPMSKISANINGQERTAYKILSTPILYEYARVAGGQVITIPAAALDVWESPGRKSANTEKRIAIKGYLLRRVMQMKGKSAGRLSTHILYSDINDTVYYGKATPKEQRAAREYTEQVLKSWSADRNSPVKGYKNLTSGRKIIGVDIDI